MCCLFCFVPVKIMKTLFCCSVITIFVRTFLPNQLCAGVTFWLSYEVKDHPLWIMLGIGYYIMGLFILIGGFVVFMGVCGTIGSICFCKFGVLCVPFVRQLNFSVYYNFLLLRPIIFDRGNSSHCCKHIVERRHQCHMWQWRK